MTLALYFLASLGIAFVVGFSKISLPFRVLLGGQPAKTKVDGLPSPVGSDVPLNVNGSIVSPAVRPLIPWVGPWLVALLECPGCIGWWIGCVAWIYHAQLGLPLPGFMGLPLVLAFATTATNLIGAKFIGMLD